MEVAVTIFALNIPSNELKPVERPAIHPTDHQGSPQKHVPFDHLRSFWFPESW